MRILIKNGYITTVDDKRRVYQNGFILIEGSRIKKIGDMAEYKGERVDKEIDAKGCIVTPGLINMHNHHWGSLVRGTGDGLLLEPWLDEVTIPLMNVIDDDILRIASYFSAIEQIRTGTTCSLNHLVTTTDEEGYKAIAEPVAEIGIRQYIAKEVRNTPSKQFSDKYSIEARHPRNLNEELGVTIVIVTHDTELTGKMDRVVAIRDGKTSSEFLRRSLYLHDPEKTEEQQEEDTHVELAVLDSANRLQVPEDYLEAIGISNSNKVRIELEDNQIIIVNPNDID